MPANLAKIRSQGVEPNVKTVPVGDIFIACYRIPCKIQATIVLRDDNTMNYQKCRRIVDDFNDSIAGCVKQSCSLQNIAPDINKSGFGPNRIHVNGHDILFNPA